MNILEKLILKVIFRVAEGDFRNREAIREWTSSLDLSKYSDGDSIKSTSGMPASVQPRNVEGLLGKNIANGMSVFGSELAECMTKVIKQTLLLQPRSPLESAMAGISRQYGWALTASGEIPSKGHYKSFECCWWSSLQLCVASDFIADSATPGCWLVCCGTVSSCSITSLAWTILD